MNHNSNIFFSLLRYAISTSTKLPPMSYFDLLEAFEIAKKQSLVGIVFSALNKGNIKPTDKNEHGEEYEDLIMEWMGENVKIVRRNDKLNNDVADVTKCLDINGFETCLLKGQGNALLYPNPSARTAGDIDLWVRTKKHINLEKDIEEAIRFVRTNSNNNCKTIYHHIDGLEWNGTEVELHYRPHFMQNFLYNARLQRFFFEYADEQFKHFVKIGSAKVAEPTLEFNIVFQISHIYQHLFKEGIGLRQVLDYFYVLKAYNAGNKKKSTNWNLLLDNLGLLNIAGAIMWILEVKFGMKRDWAIVAADEKRGRFVLNEILQGGNFGKYDERNARFGHSKFGRNIQRLVRDLRLVRYFPSEALSEPFFRLWHAWWRWRHRVT